MSITIPPRQSSLSKYKARLARNRSGLKKLDHRCCLIRIGNVKDDLHSNQEQRLRLRFVKIGSLVLFSFLQRRSKSYLLGTRAYLLAMLAKNRSPSDRGPFAMFELSKSTVLPVACYDHCRRDGKD
jgi:hypothetical protein